ncbi:hypothetical protein Sru01_41190 [Sphaerisporangium rufum]|uniref:CU044_5270 family protein n=1 Tax=Sphaerisporangium rufum TaxID=1381558 RepID=A0A919V1Y5_9ACTN|nr:CU044_5270 family protein [Sphaerisporangium rufum]GII79137.1 hypothetical protein Sru01_41190 [Sphaerisporangium rufum]
MDDLKMLRELRADVPEPGPEWLVPARRDLLQRVRARRRIPARPLLAIAALGAAAAVTVTVVQPDRPFDGRRGVPAVVQLDARVVLANAAKVAARRTPGETPRPTQWQYTRQVVRQQNDEAPEIQEHWIRYDGKQIMSEGRVEDVPPDPGDDDLSPRQYDEKLRELPTDPRRLLAKVTGDRHWIDYPKEEAGVFTEPPAERGFRVIGLYLSRYGVMPPKLEAAMFRALALIPGVHVDKDIADADGRRGIGVRLDTGSPDPLTREYLILDPDTYRYLGERKVLLRDEYVPGESDPLGRQGDEWASALLVSRIVDHPGDRS